MLYIFLVSNVVFKPRKLFVYDCVTLYIKKYKVKHFKSSLTIIMFRFLEFPGGEPVSHYGNDQVQLWTLFLYELKFKFVDKIGMLRRSVYCHLKTRCYSFRMLFFTIMPSVSRNVMFRTKKNVEVSLQHACLLSI